MAVFVPTKTEECVQRLAASNVSIQAPGETEGSILETVPVDLGGGLPAISYIQIYSASSSLLTCGRHVLLAMIFFQSQRSKPMSASLSVPSTISRRIRTETLTILLSGT